VGIGNNGVGTKLYLPSNGVKVIIGSGSALSRLCAVSGNTYKTNDRSAREIPSDARLKKRYNLAMKVMAPF
jgi:hypothetical protein